MDEVSRLENYLIVGALLFGIGLVGFFSRRNMIVMFLAAEMMLQGVSVSLVAWGRYHNDWGGQILVIFILTVAACEAAVALALILMLYRRRHSLDVSKWQDLREEDQEPTEDEMDEEPLPPDRPPPMPHLAPAGLEPEHKQESSHV